MQDAPEPVMGKTADATKVTKEIAESNYLEMI